MYIKLISRKISTLCCSKANPDFVDPDSRLVNDRCVYDKPFIFLGTMRSTKSRNSTNFAMINGARQPPRPTPSMVNYSDEDSAKGYDENPDDSDSLTEKPSEISSTDSQVCIFQYFFK